MNENGHSKNLFDILTGRNGNGPEEVESMEPADIERSMRAALNHAVANNLTTDDAFLITAISHHVDGGLFQRIARRRGSSWGVIAALADRIVQFEGLAKIHLEIAFQTQNMDIALALKSMSSLQRHDLVKKACERLDDDSKNIMYEGIAMAKDRVLRVWEKAPDDFLNDASRRMGADRYD